MAGAAARRQGKLIRSLGVPKFNVDGKGGTLTDAEQRKIADSAPARTQNGRIGGSG